MFDLILGNGAPLLFEYIGLVFNSSVCVVFEWCDVLANVSGLEHLEVNREVVE